MPDFLITKDMNSTLKL